MKSRGDWCYALAPFLSRRVSAFLKIFDGTTTRVTGNVRSCLAIIDQSRLSMSILSVLADMTRFTMLRFSDTPGYVLTELLIFFVILFPTCVISARNNRNTFKFDPQKLFFESKVLPDGDQVSAYLLYNQSMKVFYLRNENGIPVFITITPCASSVEWTVTHRSTREATVDEDYPEGDDLFSQLQGTTTTPKPTTSTGTILYQYSGPQSHAFQQQNAEEGLYTIEIRAIESDTRVHFYATTNPVSDITYPALPMIASNEGNKVVNIVTSVKRRSISVSWTASPDETPFDNIIEYCFAISLNRGYCTYCGLLAHLYGDTVMKIRRYSGFGFQTNKDTYRDMKRKANPVKPAKRGTIFHKCVGSKTKYTYTRALPNKEYFVNVYVVNRKTNRTSAFNVVSVRTKADKRFREIPNGKLRKIKFKRPRQKEIRMFQLKEFTKEVHLAIHSCTGKVKVQVQRKGRTILKTKVRNIKSYTLTDLPADNYLVKVTNSRKAKSSVRILITSNAKLRYPVLPNDTRTIVLTKTCTNVTIAWLKAEGKENYCIFFKEFQSAPKKKRRRTKFDLCQTSIVKSSDNFRNPICKRYKHVKHKDYLTHTFKDLKPGTLYQFDVLIKRRGKYLLSYRSVRIRTGDVC